MHTFETHIRNIPDFPKPGVMFKDISPLLKERLPEVVEALSANINWQEVDYVVGIESRGFILGAAVAAFKNKGFIPMRKKGKLPPPVVSESYILEYGTDTLEMVVNSTPANVVLIDDVLATGGTLSAAMALCEGNQFHVTDISVLINLTFLNQFKQQGFPINSVLNF